MLIILITVCPHCGKVLEVDEDAEETWLPCIPLEDATAMTPSGHRHLVTGVDLYRDGNGDEYTIEAYLEKWGFDPAPVWEAIEAYRESVGTKIKPVNVSSRKDRLSPKM